MIQLQPNLVRLILAKDCHLFHSIGKRFYWQHGFNRIIARYNSIVIRESPVNQFCSDRDGIADHKPNFRFRN